MNYTFKELLQDSLTIHKTLNLNFFDGIVGISRGGMFFATMLSEHSGNKKLYCIAYESYREKNRGQIKQLYPLHSDLYNKNLILVDDICDSGKTLKRAINDLEEKNNIVTSITLHLKEKSKYSPNFFLHITNSWVHYPWEIKKH